MKRAFSMIEVVFVIVIIGILAAIAIPKLSGVGEQAKANSILKILVDAESSVPPAFVNLVDMELNTTAVHLDDLLTITSSDWSLPVDSDVASYNRGGIVASITLDSTNRVIKTNLDWSGVTDSDLIKSFETVTGVASGVTERNVTIPF